MMQASLALVFLSFLLAQPLRSEPWPHWRGPLGTGVSPETALPTEWGAAKNIAWQTPLRGLGVSSPIVWGDRVFVTYQIGASRLRPGNHPTLVQGGDAEAAGERPLGGSRSASADEKIMLVVAALDRRGGKLLWEHEVPAEGELPDVHQKQNLATPSPVTDGERVYAWFSNGQLVVVGVDGKPAWSRHIGIDYSAFRISWGHASSPTLHEDRLLLLCYHSEASYLLALDKQTGKELWRTNRGKGVTSYSTPIIVDSPQGPEIIVNSSEGLEAYYPGTGERLWQIDGPNRFPIPVAVHDQGMLYTSRGYRSGPYMAIRAGGRGDVSKSHVAWYTETGAPYVSSLVHYNGLLYMANGMGIVTCVDAKTGERLWQERLGGIYTASPVAADGKIYLFSENGSSLVLRAGRTPEVLARNSLDEQFIASPAISQGQILVRSSRSLIAIGEAAR
jgi:outer membrane protein assembly factor BamB